MDSNKEELYKRIKEIRDRLPFTTDPVEIGAMIAYAQTEYEAYGVDQDREAAYRIVEEFLRSHRDIRDFALMEIIYEDSNTFKIVHQLVWRPRV